MKKITGALAIATLLLTACKKDSVSSSSTAGTIIQQGNWRVTLYNDSGVDETTHFSGYTFSFGTGSITATKAGANVNGTWTNGNDDSQEKLLLNFGNVTNFDELNDDWHVVEKTATKIRLEDVSGGGSGTDLLTFEKQ